MSQDTDGNIVNVNGRVKVINRSTANDSTNKLKKDCVSNDLGINNLTLDLNKSDSDKIVNLSAALSLDISRSITATSSNSTLACSKSTITTTSDSYLHTNSRHRQKPEAELFGLGNSNITISTSVWKPNAKSFPGRVLRIAPTIVPSVDSEDPESFHNLSQDMSKTPKKSGKNPGMFHDKSSFQQYEESTLDAWDDGDDDLLVRLKLDEDYIKSTATNIIDHHSMSTAKNGSADVSTGKASVAEKQGTGEPSPSVRRHQSNGVPSIKRSMSAAQSSRELAKQKKFEALILAPSKNGLEDLRTMSWPGIPASCRPITWKILSGYLPVAPDRRESILERKRKEYFGFLDQYFGTRHEDQYQHIFRQIHIDVPRMNPLIPLFQTKLVQEIFERILYIWAIRHPASGYVQGINDLVTPFFVVFLTEFLDADVECGEVDITALSKEELDMIEADSYWCMSKLLDGIQDNYTFAQPGIQMKVSALKELTQRIDSHLHTHIENQGIEFLQFSFRWMNNLLMRELPLRCTIRLWDTYLAEPEGFADYHLYVCAAFLTKFSKQLKNEHDFQGLMTMLQNLPTKNWGDEDIGELTAEAYRLKYTFSGAPQHLKNS